MLPRRALDTLLENSLYGIGITAVNSLFGFAFWIVAARLYPTRSVGLATALIAAMTLVSMVSNLGGGAGLVQRLPTRHTARDWSVTLNASLALCVVLSVVAAGVTLLLLPFVAHDLRVVRTSGAYALTLTAGIVLWTLSVNMDFLFVAERKVKFGFVRNATLSVLKLALVGVPVLLWSATPLTLFGTWVVSTGFALLVAVQIARRRLSHHWMAVIAGVRAEVRTMVRSLVGHHFINLGGSLPMYVLPLIVTARLGIVPNAWAYIGWMVGSFALVVSPTVSASLFAEGSHDRTTFAQQAQRSLGIITVLFIPVIVAVILLGHEILGVFGGQYARHSYGLVVVLALSAVPDAITNVYVVSLRVDCRLRAAAILNVGMALLAVILAWLLVHPLGVAGIAWAWLFAQSAGSVYAVTRVWLARRTKLAVTPPDVTATTGAPRESPAADSDDSDRSVER
jgi:O-antigen/teichoic acid export membrane protein